MRDPARHAHQAFHAAQETEASDREKMALIQSLRDEAAAAAAREGQLQERGRALAAERDDAVVALRASLEASKGGQAAVAELRQVAAARDALQVRVWPAWTSPCHPAPVP